MLGLLCLASAKNITAIGLPSGNNISVRADLTSGLDTIARALAGSGRQIVRASAWLLLTVHFLALTRGHRAAQAAEPDKSARNWTIYLAQDKHLDYNWCGSTTEVELRMVALTDYYLDLVERTDARWNLDGTIWLEVYRRHRGEEGAQRLLTGHSGRSHRLCRQPLSAALGNIEHRVGESALVTGQPPSSMPSINRCRPR